MEVTLLQVQIPAEVSVCYEAEGNDRLRGFLNCGRGEVYVTLIVEDGRKNMLRIQYDRRIFEEKNALYLV